MGGLCKNPYDLDRSCGVSSGGTGASVASGMGVLGIGTDTSGSILLPSAYCGLWGLRPPLDTSAIQGVLSMNTIYLRDTVGPLAKYLDDIVLAYSIIQRNVNIYDKYFYSINFR